MVETGNPRVSRLMVGFLRLLPGWSQTELGQAARVDQSQLSRYESLEKGLRAPEDVLRRLAAAAGVPWPLVALLARFFAAFLTVLDRWSGAGPEPEEESSLDAALAEVVHLAAEPHRLARAGSGNPEGTPAEERRRAEAIWEVLERLPPARIRQLLARAPRAASSWALAERISHASASRAAHKVEEALELARLALEIAERVPGERRRSRTTGGGRCSPFVGQWLGR